jgi:hypothetical protein
MADVMATRTETARTLKTLYREFVKLFGDAPTVQILDLLPLNIDLDFVRDGGLDGDCGNGLLFLANGMHWTSTVPASRHGYCWQFSAEQTPTFETRITTTRPLMVGHFLECSTFLEDWDLQHGLAAIGTDGTLYGYEFSNEVTGEMNNAFPEDPNSEIKGACDVWISYVDNSDESEPLPCYVYKTGPWSSARYIPEIDDEETDDLEPVDLTLVEGFLVFHGPEIFPPEKFKCDYCYKEMEREGAINHMFAALCEECWETSKKDYDMDMVDF